MAIFEDTEEEDESYGTSKSLLTQYWFIILISFFIWIIYRDQGGMIQFIRNDVYLAGFLIGMYLVDTSIMMLKHKTPKIIANPIFSTIDPNHWRTVGNWVLIKMGAIHAGNWYTSGNEGVMIVPQTAVIPRGQNIDIAAMVHKVSIEYLPSAIRKVIQEDPKKYRGPYYFGFADQETYDDIPELSAFVEELQQGYRRISSLEKENNRIINHVESVLSGIDRIGRMQDGNWKNKLMEKIKRQEEDQ